MREFFKGWRRKAGVLTLAMACAFAAMCVRSFVTIDEISFKIHSECWIGGGDFLWYHIHSSETPDATAPERFWRTRPFDPHFWKQFSSISGWDATTTIKFPGLCFVKAGNSEPGLLWLYISLLWVIVPLTLLSAYLLISKPHQKLKQPVPHA